MNYTLKNDHLNVVVDTFGAEMHSIQHDDIEYLWQADAKFWGRHAPVLFPIVGKLKNGEYAVGDCPKLAVIVGPSSYPIRRMAYYASATLITL